jgi:uncharacterized protein YndB with AHSA1/START domain
MFQIAALVIVILVASVLLLAASKPARFRIARSARIQAPAERIFPLINDFHQWVAWSPYEKLDPTMTKTFSGAASGTGAAYAWEGNNKAGKGRMEISESVPHSRIVIPLEFEKPWKASNLASFTLDAIGGTTNVTWAMEGQSGFAFKLFGLFMNMDKMVGRDFEAGLATLKTLVEKQV